MSSLDGATEVKEDTDVFSPADFTSKEQRDMEELLKKSKDAPETGHISLGGAVNSFRSASALLPNDPVRLEVQRTANQSDGVIAQRNSEAEYRNSYGGKIRQSSKSKSFMSLRKSTSVKSKRFKNATAEEYSEDAARLELIELRVANNAKGREAKEETSIMEGQELIQKFVFQPSHAGQEVKVEQTWRGFSCLITKGENFSTPGSSKPCQDAIGVAHWGNFECIVISDGHGKTGEEVAWQVTNWLPGRIIKQIVKHSQEHPDLSEAEVFEQATAKNLVTDIFFECDKTVIWSKNLLNYRWVKIIGGEFKGLMAQICDPKMEHNAPLEPGLEGDEEEIPVCVFKNGLREFNSNKKKFGLFSVEWEPPNRQMELPIEQQLIPRKYLLCERDFYGGGTCLMFVRNKSTNQFRYATAGDSRVLYIPPTPTKVPDDEAIITVRPKEYKPGGLFNFSCLSNTGSDPVLAILSVEHNISDEREMNRLTTEHEGCFIYGDGTSEAMDGYFYSNALFPYTGGLTPTRGFGDRLYYGSGYTCKPEVSETLNIEKGSIIIGGSDGVFDDAVWGDDMSGLAFEMKLLKEEGKTPAEMVAAIRNETAERCYDWNLFRVDDISLFCFCDRDE